MQKTEATTMVAEPVVQQLKPGHTLKLPEKRVAAYKGLRPDDIRHPLDAQNTRMLRRLPGLDIVARSIMGKRSHLGGNNCHHLAG